MLNVLLFASSPGLGLTYNLTQLAIDLKSNNYHPVVISSDKEQVEGLKDLLITNEIEIYVIANLDSYSPVSFYKNIRKIRNILIIEEIDLIHNIGIVYLLKSFFACKTIIHNNIAITTHLHSFLPIYMKSILLMKMLANINDLLIFVCERTTIYYSKKGLPKHKLYTVNNGIRVENFAELIDKKSIYNFNSSEKIIAYTATLHPWKGHKYYINAASKVIEEYPHVKFLLIGNGPLREELEKQANDLGIANNVIFLGQVDQDQIPSILSNIDIGVSTSLEEQFPWNILEIMATEKPVIATDVGCTQNIVKDGKTGFLVPPENVDILSSKIIELLNTPDLAKNMGKEGKKLIQAKYSSEYMIKDLGNAYRIAIKNKGSNNDSEK
jgi:Glycosyltransferase